MHKSHWNLLSPHKINELLKLLVLAWTVGCVFAIVTEQSAECDALAAVDSEACVRL